MTDSEKQIKSLFFDVVIKAVIIGIQQAVPFLGWPVIGQLFSMLVEKIASMIYHELAVMNAFIQIDIKVDSERQRYEIATEELKVALETNANEVEINEAKEKYKATLRSLIKFNS